MPHRNTCGILEQAGVKVILYIFFWERRVIFRNNLLRFTSCGWYLPGPSSESWNIYLQVGHCHFIPIPFMIIFLLRYYSLYPNSGPSACRAHTVSFQCRVYGNPYLFLLHRSRQKEYMRHRSNRLSKKEFTCAARLPGYHFVFDLLETLTRKWMVRLFHKNPLSVLVYSDNIRTMRSPETSGCLIIETLKAYVTAMICRRFSVTACCKW